MLEVSDAPSLSESTGATEEEEEEVLAEGTTRDDPATAAVAVPSDITLSETAAEGVLSCPVAAVVGVVVEVSGVGCGAVVE